MILTLAEIYSRPPAATVVAVQRGDRGVVVAAVQLAFNTMGSQLTEDGDFGKITEDAVILYQQHRKLKVDGVFGDECSIRLSQGFAENATGQLPVIARVVDGVLDTESDRRIGAVNWSVAGGCDCSYPQRRVYGPPFDPEAVRRAFNAKYQINLLVSSLKEWRTRYRDYAYVRSRPDREEYAVRLAGLRHNWPYGADKLSSGTGLSDRIADWVPKNAHFNDGAKVVTFSDWAKFYAMGSRHHNHKGQIMRYAFGVPRDG